MQDELPLSIHAFDAYIVTGSPCSVNDDEVWIRSLEQFLQRAHGAGVCLIGLCFGHQMIAKALGGIVGKPPSGLHHGWGLGIATTEFSEPRPFMRPWMREVRLLAAHGEQVLQIPPQATVLGSNAFCPNAALQIGHTAFTTQYHPEMSVPFLCELLSELTRILPASVLDKARTQLEANAGDDSELFLRWVANFIEQARA
jgi:GMP synthase-like glutamine amidotransferase